MAETSTSTLEGYPRALSPLINPLERQPFPKPPASFPPIMALSTDNDIYKPYFDDVTLSDLTIRLSDRTVHVHRIVLCRRSKYFEKLILGSFKVG